ncbi:MAG: RNA polymerase sigma factor [Armatimonadetes bacterium]|nr:RNA polymerase sigma factor [Armatimonadota bacterium]
MDIEREIARHKDAVYRQMVRLCGDADDAEDVLMEALISAFRASDQLKEATAFRSWLTSIASRACIRLRTSRKSGALLSLDALVEAGMPVPTSPGLEGAAQLAQAEMHDCIVEVLDSLPEMYRDVYDLREINGESAIATAETLGISVPAVKSRLHRARKLVREGLDNSLCGSLA